MSQYEFDTVFGAPPEELTGGCEGAAQVSPLVPGALDLADMPSGSRQGIVMLALPGTQERRHALALALRALAPGARLVALAPKDKGGSRLSGDLEALGCAHEETARRHHRICVTSGGGDPAAIQTALEDGEPRLLPDLGLWSQPGVFSWNRIDPGSALLLAHLPDLAGSGADFGCGIGILSRKVLASSKVTRLALVDIDRRALAMAGRNITDARAFPVWADARGVKFPAALDFVVMNPPFHEGGIEAQALGQTFIRSAAAVLRKGGNLWLTANRHLPYEAILKPHFARATLVIEADGYKIYQARK